MIVQIVSFGSVWFCAWRGETTSSLVVYNTTGFVHQNRQRQCLIVPGNVRFNGNARPYVELYDRLLGSRYCSPGLDVTKKGNRLLLDPRAPVDSIPDKYLVCVRTRDIGLIDFDNAWRSPDVAIVARSYDHRQNRMRQETLLLVGPDSVIKTSKGLWTLSCLMKIKN
jgi:hypothetical protein